MQYELKKIEWLHDEWRKNLEREFQTRREVREGEECRDGITVSKHWKANWTFMPTEGSRLVDWTPKWFKWQVGRDYAIQPGRGKPGVWIGREHSLILDAVEEMSYIVGKKVQGWHLDYARCFRDQGYRRLRMLVTDIGQEPLQDISEDNCLSEGVVYYPHNPYAPWGSFGLGGGWLTPKRAYEAMWDGLKPKKGHRFADNPTVFPISFILRVM